MSQKSGIRLAFVVPRFGADIGGGAETLIREFALRLTTGTCGIMPIPQRIEIWTTCARDHRSWENHYQPGQTVEEGLLIRRFPVEARDLDVFIKQELIIADGWPLAIDDQLAWLSEGVNSKALYSHIARHALDFSAVVFAPYLFATTFWGALINPSRSVLIPCLHDEPYAYLSAFSHLFASVAGVIFNTLPEYELARRLYPQARLESKGAVVGMGFDSSSLEIDVDAEIEELERVYEQPLKRYVLYAGRKETGKNLDLLIQAFASQPEGQESSPIKLVIIGSGSIDFVDELPEWVIDLGFVNNRQKQALMRRAIAFCQPSTNESFSIVLMEAWLQQTPAIVHSQCAVTREHVVRSGGGLYFSDATELAAVIRYMADNPEHRAQFANSGYRYVREEYSWDAVGGRLLTALKQIGVFPSDPQPVEHER